MAFAVDLFKGALTLGGARPNLFDVTIGGVNEKLRFTCKAAQLPSSNVEAIEVPYFGRTIKVSGDRTFPEWTITVINDEDFSVRDRFEEWMNEMNGHQTNLRDAGSASPELYKQDATVTQYSKTGVPIKTYDFVGMFPTEVGAIDVAWDNNNAIEEFTVDRKSVV